MVYSGDDERFDYVYKFVTEGKVDRRNRAANRDLLDSGTLYVARFNNNLSGEWIALQPGTIGVDGKPLRENANFIGTNDAEVLDGLDKAAVSYQIVLTKADALKKGEIQARGASAENARAQALEDTKNLANFEEVGKYGKQLGALYMFFRPAATGAVRAIESLAPAFRLLPPGMGGFNEQDFRAAAKAAGVNYSTFYYRVRDSKRKDRHKKSEAGI